MMKSTEFEWIGDIPDDWNLERLQWHLEEINQKNNPVITEQVLSLTNKLGVILYEEKGNQGNKSKDNITEYKVAFEDTLIVNSMNVLIGSVGISKYKGCVSPVYYVYKANEETDLRFINYIFNLTGFQKELRKYANGIMEIRLRISSSDILKRKIPVPSYEEQVKISDFLDVKCQSIEAIIRDTRNSIEEYKKLKQSIISDVVINGLHESKKKNSGLGWVDRIPVDWETGRLKYYYNFGKGLNITKVDLVDEGIKVISYGQVHAKINTGTSLDDRLVRYVPESYLEDNQLSLVHKGDFIVADTSEDLAGCGNCVYVDEEDVIFAGYHSIKLTPNDGKERKYLAYLFLSDLWRSQIRSRVSGIKLFSISQKILRELSIILPSDDEQEEIVKYLDEKCSGLDSLIEKKEKFISELEEYRKSLIYEYVTGKRRVE